MAKKSSSWKFRIPTTFTLAKSLSNKKAIPIPNSTKVSTVRLSAAMVVIGFGRVYDRPLSNEIYEKMKNECCSCPKPILELNMSALATAYLTSDIFA